MFLIFIANIIDDIGDVTTICSDWSKMPIDRVKEGYFVNEIPCVDYTKSNNAILKYNVSSNTIYYEYGKPYVIKSSDEKLEQNIIDIANINYALMMGGII